MSRTWPRVDAAGDRFRHRTQILDRGEQVDELLIAVVQAHPIAKDAAGTGQRVGHFEELFDGQRRADGGPADQQTDVVEAGEGRRVPLAEGVAHLGDEGERGANGVGVGARLDLAGAFLAQRRGRIAGQQLARPCRIRANPGCVRP